MPSLAGRPPFATNEPDAAYAVPAARPRPPQQQQDNRTSAYNVYDNYLDASGQPPNRTSGVGAAFMNGDMDDSDSEDEHVTNTRKPMDPHHTPMSIPVPEPVSSISGKHAALAAAVYRQDSDPNPPPQYNVQAPQPAAIAAPRPGYAAPIAALNNHSDNSRQGPPGIIQVPSPNLQIQSGTPSPTSPHPLEAPLTPIQPVFARPRPPKATDVKFTGDIMRGDKEAEMIPKRGEKGDDFWRRFSMVVKDEGTKKEKTSAWLRKTNNGNSSYATWVWIVGVILVIAAAGGIGLGWYVSHKAPDHYQPTAIGGSANESGSTSTLKSIGSAGATAKSSLHIVTPTNTVARRAAQATDIPQVVKINPDIPDWMVSKREVPEEIPQVVRIEPEVPDWMQTVNKRKRHAHNRVH